jgi:cation transport protein ChaC
MAFNDADRKGEFWVFAYGSLIWKPGFDPAERRIARLDGFTRRFGLTSKHYRGTPEKPGLVLGLDWAPGESCTGLALRVRADEERRVRDYLAERELVSYAYFETLYPVTLLCEGPGQGEPRAAICYILDRSHEQYRGQMAPEDQAAIIAEAVGPSGPNVEYLMNTLQQLRAHGIEDPHLEAMAEMVAARPVA